MLEQLVFELSFIGQISTLLQKSTLTSLALMAHAYAFLTEGKNKRRQEVNYLASGQISKQKRSTQPAFVHNLRTKFCGKQKHNQ